jgi:hypothetical protein
MSNEQSARNFLKDLGPELIAEFHFLRDQQRIASNPDAQYYSGATHAFRRAFNALIAHREDYDITLSDLGLPEDFDFESFE